MIALKESKDSMLRDLFHNPKRLAEELPFEEFIEEGRYFVLRDHSIGVIYEVELVEQEPLIKDALVDLNRNISSWLRLPEGWVAEFQYVQRYLTEKEVDSKTTHVKFGAENSVGEVIHQDRVKMMKSFCNEDGDYQLFSRKLLLGVKQPAPSSPVTLRDFKPRSGERLLLEEVKNYAKRVKDIERVLGLFESSAPCSVNRIDADEYLAFARPYLNGELIQPLASYNPAQPLREQMILKSIDCDEQGLKGASGYSRTVVFKVPGVQYPGMMAYLLKLNFPYSLALKICYPRKGKINMFLGLKEFCLRNSFSERSKREFQEIKEIQKELAFDKYCAWVSWSLTVFGKNEEEVENRANEVLAFAVEKFDTNGILERDLGNDHWWNGLALNYEAKADFVRQRLFPIVSDDLASLIPIYGSYRGSKEPMQVFQTREGALLPLSLYESESGTNFHTVILGDSGGGKSAFLNSKRLAGKRTSPEYLSIVIEEKTSCDVMAEFLGGEINKFEVGKPPSTNPFLGVYDEKKYSFLTNWIATSVSLTSPSYKVEGEQKEAINRATRNAYKKKAKSAGLKFVDGELVSGSSNSPVFTNMDEICTELSYLPTEREFENSGRLIEELLSKLRNFRGEGLYADFFRPKPVTETITKPFYGFDLEGLKSDQVLRDLSILGMFERIRQLKLVPGNENKDLMVDFDEIAALDRGVPMLSDLIVDMAEMGRKDGIWLTGATNRPRNFFELPACRAIWQVSPNKIFLPMSAENVDELGKHSSLITETDKEIIKSLRMVKGCHSEAYLIRDDGFRVVFRFAQTPSEKWQSPTNAVEKRKALEVIKTFNGHGGEALNYLVKTFPNGIV